MRQYTKEEVLVIFQQFQIEGKVNSLELYGNGHINNTYRVILEDGQDYILQQMNGTVFKNRKALMENVVGVTEFLKKKILEQGGDPARETLQVIPAKDGKSYVKTEEDEAWRVYPFIKDTVAYDLPDSPETFKKSGYAFGNFQYLLADYPAAQLNETIPNFHNTEDRFAKFKDAVEKDCMGRAAEVQKEIQFFLEREEYAHYFGDLLAKGELPLRVTHNDTKLNNVLFDRETNDAICVIDLDTVMPGFAAHDFGDTIRFGASTAAEDEKDLDKVSCDMEMFEAFYHGFMEGCRGSLWEKEVESLPMGAKVMTYECGMRFLTDYLEGDTYFKTHYEGHNLDRARTQIKLVQDMESKWEIMKGIISKKA